MNLRRRAIAGSSDIPAGYERVKYIYSHYQQYIITNTRVEKNDTIKVTAAFMAGANYYDMLLYGGNPSFWMLGIGSTTRENPYTHKPVCGYWGYDNAIAKNIKIGDFFEATMVGTTRRITVDDKSAIVGNRERTLYSSVYYIFNSQTCAKIKEAEVVGKSNFIPVIRTSDNKPGMYDTITQTFFTNQGTGEFGYEKLDGTYVAPI